MKIHCIEEKKADFDTLSIKEMREMIGWIEPPEGKDTEWDVTLCDGGIFSCTTQEHAQIMATQEEIKAMLMGIYDEH